MGARSGGGEQSPRGNGIGRPTMSALTFLIPVRHPANARDWSQLKSNIAQTVASISGQAHDDWRGLIVANHGADLPPLPERFDVEWVDFPPNAMHARSDAASKDDFLDAFRIDKGRRVLKGMLRARDSRFFMIVDDDDFVSARITRFATDHRDETGWTVSHGYIWADGGKLLLQEDDFNEICGTSLIVRTDAYGLPTDFDAASPEYIMSMLGSHKRIHSLLAERGLALQSLPFRGAIYRVGQSGSHSQAPGIVRKYFLNRRTLSKPAELAQNLRRLRLVNDRIRQEFFGTR